MEQQLELPLFDNEEPTVDSWSYGLVSLEDGAVVLAEIGWSAKDRPVMWREATFMTDGEDGAAADIIASFRLATHDIIDTTPIPVGAFPHIPRLSED